MKKPNIYAELGVTPVINAAGTFTDLGGSKMPPEVVEAWCDAAEHFVDLRELQATVGQRIAALLEVEAALVTGGAASSILLGAAAAITVRAPEFPLRPASADDGKPFEVIRQRCQRDLYDRQLQTCGLEIVEVVTEEELNAAVNERTVLFMSYNVYAPESPLPPNVWLAAARHHGIPTLVDASADTPPIANLSRLANGGFDLVAISGGKALRGPQGSGLLLGKRNLIDLATQNFTPEEGTIGRVSKASKEDMVALWKALELFLAQGPYHGDDIADHCERRLTAIAEHVRGIDTLACEWITPAVANHFPHLLLRWDESAWQLTATELATALREGSPPIATGRVYGTGAEGLLLSAINLSDEEASLVGQAIADVFALRR